jgi:hypothetical protein
MGGGMINYRHIIGALVASIACSAFAFSQTNLIEVDTTAVRNSEGALQGCRISIVFSTDRIATSPAFYFNTININMVFGVGGEGAAILERTQLLESNLFNARPVEIENYYYLYNQFGSPVNLQKVQVGEIFFNIWNREDFLWLINEMATDAVYINIVMSGQSFSRAISVGNRLSEFASEINTYVRCLDALSASSN